MKKKKKSQIGFRVAAGVMDVFGVAAAALAIVVLLLMLGSLFSWLRQDHGRGDYRQVKRAGKSDFIK